MPTQQKTAVKAGGTTLTLPHDQALTPPQQHEAYKLIASQSSPANAWGGATPIQFNISASDAEIIQNNGVWLRLDVGGATATGSTYVRFCNDASFWLDKADLTSAGSSDPAWSATNLGLTTYIQNLLHNTTEQKTLVFRGTGNGTDGNRATATAAGGTYFLPINLPLSALRAGFDNSTASGWVLRIFLQSLANVIQTDGTSPSCTINGANLVLSSMMIDQAAAKATSNSLARSRPLHYRYVQPVSQSGIPLASGSTVYSQVLTAFSGMSLSHMVVVIRANSSVATSLGNAPDSFVACDHLDLKRSDGTFITSNSLPAAWLLSGALLNKISGDIGDLRTSGPKAVYVISFGSSPESAVKFGQVSGYVQMSGSEVLTIGFASSLGSNSVVDVIGYSLQTWQASPSGTVSRVA